jgi:serine/threonine-protein kinase ULK/ATG1
MLHMIELEIDILQNLHHPNIITLHDSKYTPNNIYLIFEYCVNGDLENYIRFKKVSI